MPRLAFAAILALALALAPRAEAKGPPEPPEPTGPTASCHQASSGMCWDYRGFKATDLAASKKECLATRPGKEKPGVWSDDKPCAADGRVGRCTRKMLGTVTVMSFYPPSTAQTAESHCKMIGTPFTPR